MSLCTPRICRTTAPPWRNRCSTAKRLDELFTICDQLRPIDRELLLRYYLDDWKTPQLADHFGYQPGSVRVRLSRARRQVKQRMLESG